MRRQDISKTEAERLASLAEAAKYAAETKLLGEQYLTELEGRIARESYSRARRIYDFVGDVEEVPVKDAVDELNDWAMRNKDPITIRLNSPGGTVFDGFALYDFVSLLRKEHGIHVTVHAMGHAASMASVLLQAGDTRLISKNSWFMVHEPASLALGKASAIKDEARLLERIHKQMVGILAERSSLSVVQIRKRCERKDWWLDAGEAVKFGFADRIAP